MDRPLTKQSINQHKRKVWLKSIGGIGVLLCLLYGINWIFSPSVDGEKLRLAKVTIQTISASINAGGLVVPLIEETISSEINSSVGKVFIQPGQSVSAGDIILQLDTQKLLLAIDQVNEKVALKNNQIKTKKLAINRSINDIKSKIELLSVDIESIDTKLSRLVQLHSLGAFSDQELMEAELDAKRAKIEMRQLNQSIIDLTSTNRGEVESLNLENSILEKERTELQRLAQAATIRATREGVLIWLKNDEGGSVTVGQPLVKIVDNSQFKIEATLSDFYSSQLLPNMNAEIIYQNKKLTGKLTQQAPTINNGIMKFSITLDQPSHSLLKHNLRVDVALITQTIENTLALSKGPYVSASGLQQVFVVREDFAYRTDVEIGMSDVNRYQIISGLNENDNVIISDVSNYLHLTKFRIN